MLKSLHDKLEKTSEETRAEFKAEFKRPNEEFRAELYRRVGTNTELYSLYNL